MVISGAPSCNYVGIKDIDGLEFIVGREVSIGVNANVVTWGEKKDGWDMGDAMLAEEVFDCITIGVIVDGVLRVGEAENGIMVVNDDVVIVFFGDDFACQGKLSAKGELSNWKMSLVGVHIFDESPSMEEAVGDIDGNRANLLERVAHETCNDGPVIGSVVDGGDTDDGNGAFVLEDDGGSLGDEGLEVDKGEVGHVESIGKPFAESYKSIGGDVVVGGVLSCGKGLIFLREGRESIVVKETGSEHCQRS